MDANKPNNPGEVVRTDRYINVTVDGYDAAFWNQSYRLLRDAIEEHLPQFIHGDDVAEEHIYCETVQRVGHILRDVQQDEETGEYDGPVHLGPPVERKICKTNLDYELLWLRDERRRLEDQLRHTEFLRAEAVRALDQVQKERDEARDDCREAYLYLVGVEFLPPEAQDRMRRKIIARLAKRDWIREWPDGSDGSDDERGPRLAPPPVKEARGFA